MKQSIRDGILVIGGHPGSLTNFRGPLLKSMRDRGLRVIAAAPNISRDPNCVSALTKLGVDWRDVPLSRTGLNPIADLHSLGSMVGLMRRERPTAVLGYTAKPVIFGTIAASLARVPRRYALVTGLGYAFTAGGGITRPWVRSVLTTLYRFAFRRTTKVFFQNRDDAALFRELGMLPPDLRVVIINGSGVDLRRFEPAPFPRGPLKFLLIARMLSAKGIREYADAAQRVRQNHTQVEFHLVGGHDSNPDAISIDEVKSWHAAGNIIWHGEVSDVRPHIAGCHVYVLPSYREGTPRSVLEAMAMGRPIITTYAPGCRETVIEGENGFLVPPHTVEPLIDAIELFVRDPQLVQTLGARSRALAESKFDVDKINADMLREMDLV